jgi:hypothetical protein
MSERCSVTELLPDECACPQHRNVTDDNPLRNGVKYRVADSGGICGCCEESRIRRGDRIVYVKGKWAVYDCPNLPSLNEGK